MRILITGSAGFIGSHLAERFLRLGHQVIGVDNYVSGQRQTTEFLMQFPSYRFIEADVTQLAYTGEALDWVLHFASLATPAQYQQFPVETLLTNGRGTELCLELALQHSAKFMFASTSEIYGDPLVHPQPETYWGNVNPVGPRACYDEAKRYGEALTAAYQSGRQLDTRIIRIFNTYGPRMRLDDERVVTTFMRQVLAGLPLSVYGDGDQTRSFQYIDDLIDGVVKLMAVNYHAPVNLGSEQEVTVLELARQIKQLSGSSPETQFEALPQDDPRRRKPDISLARSLLGWQPNVSLSEGLKRTFESFQKSSGQGQTN